MSDNVFILSHTQHKENKSHNILHVKDQVPIFKMEISTFWK